LVILDDAQRKYNENSKWEVLIKAMPQELKNCRVIISAVHLLKPEIESPVYFSRSATLTRKDFLLSHQESLAFLSDNSFGLGKKFEDCFELKTVIANECGGVIGALALSCDELHNGFPKSETVAEDEALRFYFSNSITESMKRCFGSNHSRPVSNEVKDYLERFIVGEPATLSIQTLEEKDKATATTLLKSGILEVVEESNEVKFTSRMAERFYVRYLYPNRATKNPESLRELIKSAIEKLPYNALKNAVHDSSFPKEAVFQHLFMNSLLKCTKPMVAVHPELSQPFGSREKITGEIDFYVDGDLCWGIELLTKGQGLGEHMSCFAADG
jgi:hypothetical protein